MGNTLESISEKIKILINIENKKEVLSPIKIEDYLNIVQKENLKKFNFTILIKKLKEKNFSENILEKLNTHYKNKKDFLIENLITINKLDDFKDNSFSINDQSYCCLFWITER
jgi:putative ribosome biogenesis GTPase RsgA